MEPLKKLDLEVINKLITDGYIRKQVHPSGELTIYNYTEKAMFNKVWTPETLQCRGLIADNEGNIVARPFPKFFNLGENGQKLPDEPFEVYEKLDGSLGISYFHNGQHHIASRGAFTSRQSIYATNILRSSGIHLREDVTYLFEIIYPENRIVIDYGEEKSLTLLGLIETETGYEIPLHMFETHGHKIVKKYDDIKDINKLSSLNEKNKEGFVIKFQSGLRVKIKFPDYVKLHSIITQMTKRKVWEVVKEGKEFSEFAENIPDELYGWIRKTEQSLKDEYGKIESGSKINLGHVLAVTDNNDRKALALMITKLSHPHVIFKMLDNKEYSDAIWKILEPAHEIPEIDGSNFYESDEEW